jgi:drug/metabolite transporter (DMT)-like permease
VDPDAHLPFRSAAEQTIAAADLRRGRIYIVVAALVWSTAGVLQRALAIDTATQIAGRAFFALLGLLVYVALAERGRVLASFRSVGLAGLGFALCLAVSSGAFIVALNHTTVANVLFLQAASPIIAALLGRVLLGERVTGTTWVAMAVALAGVGLMVGGPGGAGIGVAVAVVMTFGFAASLVFARHRPDVSMAPATCLAQLLLLAASAPLSHPGQVGGKDALVLFVFGVGQIGLGLVLLVLAAQLLPAAEVALLSLLEVVLAPLWVWLARGEEPATATLAGGVVVIAAVTLQAVGGRPRLRRRVRAAPAAAEP